VGYTPVPVLVFLGLSVIDIGPMYVTDRRQSLNAPTIGAGHNKRLDLMVVIGITMLIQKFC